MSSHNVVEFVCEKFLSANTMSLISISQSLTEADLAVKILFFGFLMFALVFLKGEEEGASVILCKLTALVLYLFAKCTMWYNNAAQLEVESPDEIPERVNKKKVNVRNSDRDDAKLLEELDEILQEKKLPKLPSPVSDDKRKKSSKKNKRSTKKTPSKENKEPSVLKEKTKMYDSINACQMLNMTHKDIYEKLHQHTLNEYEMKMNNYPSVGYLPQNLVEADSSLRSCARCGMQFEVSNGFYLSSSKCRYHSKKAVFGPRSQAVKTYPCCDKIYGEEGCTEGNYHVTVQHGPRPLTKTASRRHVRKDLQHRIFSLDCEMSYTTAGLEVTRIALVDIDGLAVYDSFVKPKNLILDYNTQYSGVEKRHLQHVVITLDDVKKILNNIIHEDTILVGHALNNDLAALGLIHKTVVDTSVLYKNENRPYNKRSLKSLAFEYLGTSIQDDPSGHDCVDDARASLQLALLKVPPNPKCVQMPLNAQENFVSEQPLNEVFSYEPPQPLMQIQNFSYSPLTISYDIIQHQPEFKKSWYFNAPLGYYNPHPALMKRCV